MLSNTSVLVPSPLTGLSSCCQENVPGSGLPSAAHVKMTLIPSSAGSLGVLLTTTFSGESELMNNYIVIIQYQYDIVNEIKHTLYFIVE